MSAFVSTLVSVTGLVVSVLLVAVWCASGPGRWPLGVFFDKVVLIIMVWHLVFMTPRADLSPGDRQALVDAFNRAVREIPTVREVRVGRRISHGAAYEMAAQGSADYVASIGFDDLAGLETYLRHPAHEELAARFYQSLSSALIYDFEMDVSIAGENR